MSQKITLRANLLLGPKIRGEIVAFPNGKEGVTLESVSEGLIWPLKHASSSKMSQEIYYGQICFSNQILTVKLYILPL